LTPASTLETSRPQSQSAALPSPRGPISDQLLAALRRPAHQVALELSDLPIEVDPEDLHLALYCCYELHYQGLPGVDDGWEWEPALLRLRGLLEDVFETQLRTALPDCDRDGRDAAGALWAMTGGDTFSLSGWLLDNGTRGQAEELAIHRSAYQLKEADPHTWAIPRLAGRAKAAMVKIQADEYGGGVAAEMHASLFADTMRALGLDPTYGAYLDLIPAVTLATTNLISMFGLHRRLRGALVGHLAGFEMNSVVPMSRYSTWLERLGVAPEGRRFYDIHVAADQVHQHIAVDDLVGGFLESEPDQGGEVVFGARALALVEAAFANHLHDAWSHGRTSLRSPHPPLHQL
jgi:hypothetical protein